MTRFISLGRKISMGSVLACVFFQGTLAQTLLTELVAQKESPNFHITDIGASVPFESNKNIDPLLNAVEGKKLLLIGEATHGAGTIYLFKYDLFKKLVHLNKAKCLLIEAQFNSVLKLDDFVSGSSPMDSLASGLNKMPFMHRTEEFKDLILWMRDYNTSREPHEHVHIYGIDVQDVDVGFEFIRNYFSKTDKSYADSLSTFLPTVPNNPAKWYHNVYTDEQISNIRQHLEAVRKNVASDPEKSGWALAARVVENIRICSYMYSHLKDFKRDLHMAENVKWILNLERKDMIFVVSAHNEHVSNDGRLMGTYLKEAFGDEVYTLGIDFGQGQIMAVSAAPDTVRSFKMHNVLFLEADSINLTHLNDRVRWIQPIGGKNDVMIRNSGASYNQKRSQVYWTTVNLPSSFDSIVYFDRVFPSTVLPISR